MIIFHNRVLFVLIKFVYDYEVISNISCTYSLFFQYYPAFIISDLCYKMLEDAHEGKISITDEPELKEDPILCTPPATGETNMAKAHLDHVNEKLQNKVQALKALQVKNFNVF